MKEKIDQYAKGIFEYHMPEVVLGTSELSVTVDAGEIVQGSFRISNSKGRSMRGIVCTDCSGMILEKESFSGQENDISFAFRGTYCQPGDIIKGEFQILSDCGVAVLPFTVTVTVPYCETSAGRIRDLNQFTELVKSHYIEALRIFQSPAFERIFLQEKEIYLERYRGLLKGNDKSMALEEFLIAAHKKTPVQLSVEKRELQYPKCENIFADKIVLHKDTWGYGEYEVKSDAPFVRFERSCIRTTDFTGDTYELVLVINPDCMAIGHNFARITISSARQQLELKVIARRYCMSDEERRRQIQQQKDVWNLYRSFLYYQAGKMSRKDFISSAEKSVNSLDQPDQTGSRYQWLVRVFRIYLALQTHKEEAFHLEMTQLEERLLEIREQEPLLYCAYYYLMHLWKPEAAERAGALSRVRECYQNGHSHWLILWFLLQMDDSYQISVKRQEAILQQIEAGCHSPLLYLELCRLYNNTPELVLELTEAKAQALHWGLSNRILEEELQFRYAYLISRTRDFTGVMMGDLYRMYEARPSDDLLTMICQLLMRERRVSPEDVKWYRLGIEHNLKITDLYENYIYALEETPDMVLPNRVLLYFSYNNQLNATKKAMLYAYVIRHKDRDQTMYDSYKASMEKFALEQLEQGRVNDDLSVIYEEFIREDMINEQIASALPSILFAREIRCSDPRIAGVVVRHRELQQEETAAFVKGKAMISVFTPEPQIFLTDREGRRYASSIGYTVHRMVHLDHLVEKCLPFVGDNVRVLLYLYQRAVQENRSGEDISQLRRRVLGIAGLDSHFRKSLFAIQMQYYFDNFQGELLDTELEHMDWENILPRDRSRFMEYCAVRHKYEKGMEGLLLFGWNGIDSKKLLKIAGHAFVAAEEDKTLTKLAWHIFKGGEFDKPLLVYLCDHYFGTIPEMVKLWTACREFGIDIQILSERLLAQILFTDQMVPEAYPVFFYYEEQGFNKKLIRAFLKRTAYRYLVHGDKLPDEIFESFYQHVQVEENRPCLLAVLKYLSGRGMLTGGEAVFVDYNLHQLYEKDIVLPYFQAFKDKLSLPDTLLKEQYVDYTADPEHDVKIRYTYIVDDQRQAPVTETMRNVFEGIRVRGFILFQDETVEYEIIETDAEGHDKKTEPARLVYTDQMRGMEGVSGYQMLNKMLMKQRGGEDALLDQMQEYAEKRAIVKFLMKPDDGGIEKNDRG